MYLSPTFATLAVSVLVAGAIAACSPNFQDLSLSISNGFGIEWSISDLSVGSLLVAGDTDPGTGEFQVDQEASNEYVFKASSLLGVSADGDAVYLDTLNVNDSAQRFTISCNGCDLDGTVDAAGCRITSVATGRCVHYVGDPGGDIVMKGCNPRAGGQLWRFTAAP